MTDGERRYTDQELALVLRRAAELEDQRDHAEMSARGLTRDELIAIAREVGFGPDVLEQAIEELRRGTRLERGSYLGPAPTAKRVKAVPGALTEPELAPLIQRIEDRVAAAGTVTEALGSVRWTSVPSGRHLAPVTQVSFTPAKGETHIQATRRYPPRARVLAHVLPGSWGGMIGVVVAGSAAAPLAAGAAIVAGGVALGAGIGRAVWRRLASRNEAFVDDLTSELADAAARSGAASSETPGTGAGT